MLKKKRVDQVSFVIPIFRNAVCKLGSVDVSVVDTVPMDLSPLAAAASAEAAAREEPSPQTLQVAVKEQVFLKPEEIGQAKPFPEVSPKPNESEKKLEVGENVETKVAPKETQEPGEVSKVGPLEDEKGGQEPTSVLDQPEARGS